MTTSRQLASKTAEARAALLRAQDVIIHAQSVGRLAAVPGNLEDDLAHARRAVNDALLSVEELAAFIARLDIPVSAWRAFSPAPVRLFKLPARYVLDWALILPAGTIGGFAELKCRRTASRHYPSLMLSLDKVLAGLRLGAATGTPFLLFVSWTDGLYWCEVDDQCLRSVYEGGRQDRGDPEDREPVVHFPIDNFRVLRS